MAGASAGKCNGSPGRPLSDNVKNLNLASRLLALLMLIDVCNKPGTTQAEMEKHRGEGRPGGPRKPEATKRSNN